MSARATVVRSSRSTRKPTRSEVAILLYGLTGGVLWWAFHLVALSAYAPAVCDGHPRWTLSLINGIAVIGVLSALASSLLVIRLRSPDTETTGRARFMGFVAVLFNLISLALVILESVPVYVLGSCV